MGDKHSVAYGVCEKERLRSIFQILKKRKRNLFLIFKPYIIEMEEIPPELVINLGHTGINSTTLYVPVSNLTMAKEGDKRIEISSTG